MPIAWPDTCVRATAPTNSPIENTEAAASRSETVNNTGLSGNGTSKANMATKTAIAAAANATTRCTAS